MFPKNPSIKFPARAIFPGRPPPPEGIKVQRKPTFVSSLLTPLSSLSTPQTHSLTPILLHHNVRSHLLHPLHVGELRALRECIACPQQRCGGPR